MPDDKTERQAQMLANRLVKKFKHLSKWAQRTGAGTFRLYDRDIPEIPLVLDYYSGENSGGAVSGALYKRPSEKDEDEETLWLETMRRAAAEALGIQAGDVYLKQRQRQRGANQYEKQSNRGLIRIVRENALRYKVNLSDYLDTGLFPDRRLLRAMLRQCAAGKRVLNLFCHTGSFSLAAAAGGAYASCSVDLSNTYLNWAQENFSLNKIKSRLICLKDYWPCRKYRTHALIRADALVFLKEAEQASCKWDMIILDPPAFSNSKKMTGVLDLKRDYLRLLEQCLALLSPDGELWLSINAKTFSVNSSGLTEKLKPAYPDLRIADLTRQMTDEDFRGRKVPQTFLIRNSG